MNHPDLLREVARTGGPAYPSTVQLSNEGEATGFYLGMTLRDYFAIHAPEEDIQRRLPTGLMIDVVTPYGPGGKSVERRPQFRTREQARYAFADAMLQARGG